MFFSTVIEILVSVFTVYGLYELSKHIAIMLAYNKNIRCSAKIAVEIYPDDNEEVRELKELYARQLARNNFVVCDYIVILNDEDE